jgi:hypothetical protein
MQVMNKYYKYAKEQIITTSDHLKFPATEYNNNFSNNITIRACRVATDPSSLSAREAVHQVAPSCSTASHLQLASLAHTHM